MARRSASVAIDRPAARAAAWWRTRRVGATRSSNMCSTSPPACRRRSAATLKEIEGTPRRLLAARAYLRAGEGLRNRWSWSAEEIRAHTQSAEYRALIEETEQVRRASRRRIRVTRCTPTPRRAASSCRSRASIATSRWQTRRESLHKQAFVEIAKPRMARRPRRESVERFKKFLTRLASADGRGARGAGDFTSRQLRAIDFQIMKDGAIVAPTETATVKRNWDAPGWTEKLQAAVCGQHFAGRCNRPTSRGTTNTIPEC